MVELSHKEFNDVIVVTLMGDLIFSEAKEAEEFFVDIVARNPKTIGVECRKLRNLDSSGLGVFIKLAKDSKKSGIMTYFLDISSQISTLFDASKLDSFFETMTGKDFQDKFLQ